MKITRITKTMGTPSEDSSFTARPVGNGELHIDITLSPEGMKVAEIKLAACISEKIENDPSSYLALVTGTPVSKRHEEKSWDHTREPESPPYYVGW